MNKKKKVIVISIVSFIAIFIMILCAKANYVVSISNQLLPEFKSFGRFELSYATANNVAGVEQGITNNPSIGTPQRLSGDHGGRISRTSPDGKVYGGGGNSSSSILSVPSGNAVIYKAYLLQESTGYSPEASKIMAEIPMTLKGPKGGQIKAEPKRGIVYNSMMDSSDTIGLTSTVTDVTEFVKAQGFGTYEGWDIPYYNRGNKWRDQIGSWKLIVICEDENLPIRMVRLDLGCKSTNASYVGTTEVTIDGAGVTTKANGAVTGQVLIGGSGGDPDHVGSEFEFSPSTSIGHFNLNTGAYGNINRSDGFYQGIATENGRLRTDIKSVGNRISDGLPFQNTDLILMNVNNAQSNMSNGHNAYLINNSDKVSVRATTTNANSSINAFGLIADIDIATYTSSLTHVGTSYMGKDLVMNAHVENNTSVDKVNLGTYGGYSLINVDSNIKLDTTSINAIVTDRNGNKTTLPSNLISVNGNQIKVTFGTSSEGISHKGDKLDVTFKGKPSKENIAVSNNLAMYATHWIDESNRNHAFDKLTLMTNSKDNFNILYNSPPVITGTDKVFYQGQYTSDYWLNTLRWKDMAATDVEDGNITSKVKVTYDNVDLNVPNVYKVVYSVTDSFGKSTSKEIKVTVKFNTPPVITATDKVFYEGQHTSDYWLNTLRWKDMSATDVEDGNITSKVKITYDNVDVNVPNVYKVVYSVTDSFGKSTSKEIKVTVKFNNPPTISGEDRWFYVEDTVTSAKLMERVKAKDIEDGNITAKAIIKSSNVQSGVLGNYKVTYKVTDAYGKSAETTVNVQIVSNTPGEDETTQYLRFINATYMNTLQANSIWKQSDYQSLLNATIAKTRDDEAIEIWHLTKEDMEAMKAFHIANDYSSESANAFYEQFKHVIK